MPLDKYDKQSQHQDNDESTYINEIYCYPLSINHSSDSEHDCLQATSTFAKIKRQANPVKISVLKNSESVAKK
jgi:hypothetical protein